MNKSKIFRGTAFLVALTMAVISTFSIVNMTRSSASIVKNHKDATSTSSLSDVIYDGKKMYVAKSTFYDYYSDSQVGTSAMPGPITDGISKGKNTFGKFNTRLMELMKYNNKAESPAKYPMYQGRKDTAYSDYANIFSLKDNTVNENSNYWIGANYNQIGNYATLGLVDSKLAYDGEGVSYVTQSNSANGKSAYVPYFNKKFLTQNKHANSQLALGSVKENVAFPFRTEIKDDVPYYEFDSSVDTVRFNSKNQLDYLGKNNQSEMVKDVYNNGGLFPTNVKADSNSEKLNFGFGMKIEVPFNMTSDGKINDKDIIFEFSGDDDVWVFIDGILALDLGGCHPKVSGSINFATGKTLISGVKNNRVAFATRTITNYGKGEVNNPELGIIHEKAVYENYEIELSNELKTLLKDSSKVHTLTMFYLERGKSESNMKLKFNLPEPNKLAVANKVVTDEVGDTFKEATNKVSKSDNFVYDVMDKTKKKTASIDLLDGEDVSFIEEFDEKDSLIVQERALKITDRKLTDLYSTSWVLADAKSEIAKDASLVVRDTRTTDKSVLFQNLDKQGVPKLKVNYTNKPIVGTFNLVCNVTDKYKEMNKDYTKTEFKYTVSYSKVFGGDSSEALYKGKYIVNKTDGTTENKSTEDGVIVLKPGERAEILSIPVQTNIKVKPEITEKDAVVKAKTTVQFDFVSKDKDEIAGIINKNVNIVEYIIGTNKEKAGEKEVLTDEEIKNLTNDSSKEEKTTDKKLVNSKEFDNSPKTADTSNMYLWIVVLGISLFVTLTSGAYGIHKRNK